MKKWIVLLVAFCLVGCSDKLVEQTRGYVNAKIDPSWEVLEISRAMDEDGYKKVWVEIIRRNNKKSLDKTCGYLWYKNEELYVDSITSDRWEK